MNKLSITVLILSLAAANAVATSNSQQDLHERLSQKLGAKACFSASFEQALKDEDGTLLQSTSGTIQAAKPNQLRWSIIAPDTQLIISDGETLWRYEEDLEQLIVSSFDEQGAGVPAKLLSGDIDALAQYDISAIDDVYELIAKEDNSLFTRMALVFTDNELTQIRINDNFLQQTTIDFTPADLACSGADLYSFVAPVGVDIIYE